MPDKQRVIDRIRKTLLSLNLSTQSPARRSFGAGGSAPSTPERHTPSALFPHQALLGTIAVSVGFYRDSLVALPRGFQYSR